MDYKNIRIRPSTTRCNRCGVTPHDGLIPVMVPSSEGTYTRQDICRVCKGLITGRFNVL